MRILKRVSFLTAGKNNEICLVLSSGDEDLLFDTAVVRVAQFGAIDNSISRESLRVIVIDSSSAS